MTRGVNIVPLLLRDVAPGVHGACPPLRPPPPPYPPSSPSSSSSSSSCSSLICFSHESHHLSLTPPSSSFRSRALRLRHERQRHVRGPVAQSLRGQDRSQHPGLRRERRFLLQGMPGMAPPGPHPGAHQECGVPIYLGGVQDGRGGPAGAAATHTLMYINPHPHPYPNANANLI